MAKWISAEWEFAGNRTALDYVWMESAFILAASTVPDASQPHFQGHSNPVLPGAPKTEMSIKKR